MEQVLERAAVTSQDRLIFLGDYVDGWSEAVETVNFLIGLKQTHNCILLRGNHDALSHDWLKEGKALPMWLQHGGAATMDSYNRWGPEIRPAHLAFYEALDNYYLDERNRLFLHAGYTDLKGVHYEYFHTTFYWDRTLWELALSVHPELSEGDARYPPRLANYKEIFIGHTPVTRIGKTTPVKAANVWNLDTGAAFNGPLTVMDVATGEFWQSDPVHVLYPGEEGRN